MSIEVIKNYLKDIPQTPGIYKMIDAKGDVIYVGKAKNLRARLVNYTSLKEQTTRIAQMIVQISSIEIIQTNNELEALLLEANLIKKYKPKYNILLKDDKSFPYILIREDHEFPQIMKYRGLKEVKGRYFGPFTSPQKLDKTISYLQKAFLLRSCSDSYFASRKRPCLLYQIKRCSAPCVSKINQADYSILVSQSKDFLLGKNNELKSSLVKEMKFASENFNYELAAVYRDRLKILEYTKAKQVIDLDDSKDIDVIVVDECAGCVGILIVFFRNGQNLGSKMYFPDHAEDLNFSEALERFLMYYYVHNQLPSLVLTNVALNDVELMQQALQQIAGSNTVIQVPKQGKKYDLIKFAMTNIKMELEKKQNDKMHHVEMLNEMRNLFGVNNRINRIEIYDNSHISGKFAIGGMVVSGEEGFDKSQYRKYNITLSTTGDDYLMLREVLTRRFKRDLPRPDLVLIDGGAGQLSIANEIIGDKTIAVVAIAKGPDRNAGKEEFYQVGKDKFTMPANNKLMKYLQILRDEAHRFAITSHRAKRSKAIRGSKLDEINGIGAKRKKLLLAHFGSTAAMESATIEDLQKVKTISLKVAQSIFQYFHASKTNK